MKALLLFLLTAVVVESCTPKTKVQKQEEQTFEQSQPVRLPIRHLPYLTPRNLYVFSVYKSGQLTDTVFLMTSGYRAKQDSSQFKVTWKENFEDFTDTIGGGTGVKSTGQRVFLHPIRSGEYKILEFCPFPQVYFDSTSWVWNIYIGNSWLPEPFHNKDFQLKCEYSQFYQGDTIITIGKGRSPLGTSLSRTSYIKNKGFVTMDFTTVNAENFHFKLLEILNFDEALQRNKLIKWYE